MKKLAKLRLFAAKHQDRFIVGLVGLLLAQSAAAAGFSLPGFTTLGCSIINWITNELSVMVFFIVVVVTLLIGFFAKMDWTKILGVIVLLGFIKGVTTLFTGFVTLPASCIVTAAGL